MPFIEPSKLPKMELFPGALSGLVASENIMLSFLEMEQGSEVPPHSHPHEQAGLLLEGKFRFNIGGEEKLMQAGDAFIVPPNVMHEGVVIEGPAKVLDIFSPVRQDYLAHYNNHTQTSDKTIWK